MNPSRRPSAPTASAKGPPDNWVRSCLTVVARLSIDVLVFHASPRNWVASACAWTRGVFAPNGLTCPLLSSGRIPESDGKPLLTRSVSLVSTCRNAVSDSHPPISCALSPSTTRVWSEVSVRRSEEHTSELQSQSNLVCRLLLVKKNMRADLMARSSLSRQVLMRMCYPET